MSIVIKKPENLRDLLTACNRYLLEQERSVSPGNDQTGERQANNNNRSDAWFMVGSFGNIELITRRVTIPAHRPIFVLGCLCDDSYAENRNARTATELASRAQSIFNTFDEVTITVDKTVFTKDKLLKERTDAIQIRFPEDNVYKDKYLVKPGDTLLVSFAHVGYFDPLQEGKHEISIRAHHPANKELNITDFEVNVKYEITVRDLSAQELK